MRQLFRAPLRSTMDKSAPVLDTIRIGMRSASRALQAL